MIAKLFLMIAILFLATDYSVTVTSFLINYPLFLVIATISHNCDIIVVIATIFYNCDIIFRLMLQLFLIVAFLVKSYVT